MGPDELEFRLSDDVSATDWIAPRLGGKFGAVTLAVPSGYAGYARICHPATVADGRFVTWPEVGRHTGRTAHALMQWHALVGSRDPLNFRGSVWPGGDPQRGNLVPEILGPLCELLARHTSTAAECFFCVWEGWGGIGGNVVSMISFPRRISSATPEVHEIDAPMRLVFSDEQLRRARVELPGREYLLLEGPLAAALQIGRVFPHADPQSPNLFWPADRTWCIASEIDFDSTLVGGTSELIETILGDETFDAWPVRPDDSLAADADRINGVTD